MNDIKEIILLNKCDIFSPATPLVKPRPPSATSIPAILKSLQDEWVTYTLYFSLILVLMDKSNLHFCVMLSIDIITFNIAMMMIMLIVISGYDVKEPVCCIVR